MKTAVALLFFAAVVSANDFNLKRIWEQYGGGRQANEVVDDSALWFDQRLDHFEPSSTTFRQRYYVNDQFWNAEKGGPVFFYIGGEAALTSGSITRGFVAALAQEFGGLLVGLEHRYYGLSHPFPSLTTANMRFLSSQQALSDAANFRAFITDRYATGSNLWVSVGGSYPGSLSAWSRLKFPHLFAASLASSAPVNAKADFFEYDQVVNAAAGPKCAARIRNATHQVEEALKTPQGRLAVKAGFQCEAIEDDVEFLYVIADMVAFAIQYKDSVGDKLCGPMEAADDVLFAYQQYALWLLNDYLRTDATTFNIAAFTNTTWTEQTNMRQWMYQSCVEFGYFQTAPAVDSLRSTRITLDWHYNVCKKLYEVPLIPNVDWTNDYYGSNNTAATKVYFTNGNKDPWHFLSVQETLSPTEIAEVIDGTAHCADLHAASPSDPKSLTEARAHVVTSIRQWLSEQ